MSPRAENHNFALTLPALLSAGGEPLPQVRTVRMEGVSDIALEETAIRSAVAVGTPYERTNAVHALLARPAGRGPFPALLLLHGGRGCAEEEAEKLGHWARLGFVAMAVDLPGIADPAKTTASAGAWRAVPYGEGRWTDDPRASTILDGVTAAWHALRLLRAESTVRPDRIGLTGVSWGGYMVTMIASLAGDAVRAVFSTFGCAYYDRMLPGEQMSGLGTEGIARWRALLDPSHRLEQLRAPYFVAAATNDFFFWPPGVEETLESLGGRANHVYAPNADHQIPVPGGTPPHNRRWCLMEEAYFAYWLQGRGEPFPRVVMARTIAEAEPRAMVVIDRDDRALTAQVFYTTDSGPWKQRTWHPLAARRTSEGIFEAVLPEKPLIWFALLNDGESQSFSSRMVSV